MTETHETGSPSPAAGGATTAGAVPASTEPARMSPIARFLGVFFSPGPVFEDNRRNPAGWWVPIAIAAVLTAIFSSAYASRYDMGLVLHEQLKDHWSMKLVMATQGPEARDKALDGIVKQTAATPAWQLMVSQWGNALVGWALYAWFFTFLYGLIAVLMGWVPDARTSRLWINLGIVAAVMAGLIVLGAGLQVAQSVSAKAAGEGAATRPPPPGWIAVCGVILAVVTAVLILWSLSKLARELPFGRILGAVCYGAAPMAVGALVGLIIVFIRTPDATSLEEVVPSTLTALLNLKGEGAVSAALASLGSSLGLFSLWSVVLTTVGLSKALGRSTGTAAAAVLLPWGLWILSKAALAAVFA